MASKSNGQNRISTFNEIVTIKTNNNVYLNGEKILFKIYCRETNTNKLSNFSKVVYIDIIDNSKKIVSQQKVFLENGEASGDFFIPLTLVSGIYNIVCFTNYMKSNNEFDVISMPVLIINPYKENANFLKNNLSNELKVETKKVTPEIQKENINKTFKNRAKVEISFPQNMKNLDCENFLVSIRKKDSLDKTINNQDFNKSTKIKGNSNTIPEHRGEIISGKIYSKKGNLSIKDISISLSIPGKKFETKLTTTDKNGHFLFNLEKSNSNAKIQIQIVNPAFSNYTLELDKNSDNDYAHLNFDYKLNLTEKFAKTLQQRFTANQIENAYSKFKKDSILKTDWNPFFDLSQSKEYILDNYTRFPSIKETIIEILEGVSFINKKGLFSIIIKDYDLYNIELPALVLVDGQVITDINDLLNHNANLINKINFINKQYFYGGNLYSGLISFTTFNQDYEIDLEASKAIFNPQIIRPLEKKKYLQPNYSIQNPFTKRIPDYRYQLYWEPNYKISTEKEKIQFYTSDIKGEFEINISGIDSLGKIHEYSELFYVE